MVLGDMVNVLVAQFLISFLCLLADCLFRPTDRGECLRNTASTHIYVEFIPKESRHLI